MRPELSNHQAVPSLPSPVGAVTDVHCESGGGGGGQTLVYPVTQPPPVTFPLSNYYVAAPLGLGGSSAVTTSAAPWPQTQYVSTSRAPAYGIAPKPEMAILLPVCAEPAAGHVVSPRSVGSSPTGVLASPPPPLNPLMNSTKYVVFISAVVK